MDIVYSGEFCPVRRATCAKRGNVVIKNSLKTAFEPRRHGEIIRKT